MHSRGIQILNTFLSSFLAPKRPLSILLYIVGVFGPRNIFTPTCMSTEPSVCTGILLSSRYVSQSHTIQHETFLCTRDMLASGKHQPSRQRGKGETAVLSGSQGGCVFRQDCLSTKRRYLGFLEVLQHLSLLLWPHTADTAGQQAPAEQGP